MKIKYDRLVSLEIFYDSTKKNDAEDPREFENFDRFESFELIPDSKTDKIMEQFRLVVKKNKNCWYLFYQREGPLMQARDFFVERELSFLLKITDNSFYSEMKNYFLTPEEEEERIKSKKKERERERKLEVKKAAEKIERQKIRDERKKMLEKNAEGKKSEEVESEKKNEGTEPEELKKEDNSMKGNKPEEVKAEIRAELISKAIVEEAEDEGEKELKTGDRIVFFSDSINLVFTPQPRDVVSSKFDYAINHANRPVKLELYRHGEENILKSEVIVDPEIKTWKVNLPQPGAYNLSENTLPPTYNCSREYFVRPESLEKTYGAVRFKIMAEPSSSAYKIVFKKN